MFALADVFVTQRKAKDRFTQFQYISNSLLERSNTLLTEHILSVAIKLRYLDDRSELLKGLDRKQLHVTNLNDNDKSELKDIRWALNKLIHQAVLELSTDTYGSLVGGFGSVTPLEGLGIPPGNYEDEVVMIYVKGEHNGKEWRYRFCLMELLNEILRVLYLAKPNK